MIVGLHTPLCALLGIEAPIVQAPMGSVCTPELAAAVANAGGLGMIALTWSSPALVTQQLAAVAALTDRPVGVNLGLSFQIAQQLAAALEAGVRVISTFWGDPTLVHADVHAGGALHLHTVGSAEEAKRAVDAGVDVIVAQGWEAGGHVWGQVATMALVPGVVDAAGSVPVIAAGGIADGRGLAAALMLGAQAVWLGTRFLTALEANTHYLYRRHVTQASAVDAVYTMCFDGGWPDAPHRALRNSTMVAWEQGGQTAAPSRPGEGEVTARDTSGTEHRRYDDIMPLRDMHGDLEAMALYAGQGVGLVTDVAPAGEIVERLVSEALTALGAFGTASG